MQEHKWVDSDAWDWREGVGKCEVGNGAWAMGVGRWAVLHEMGGGQGRMGAGQGAIGQRNKGEGTYVYKGCRCAWVCTRNPKHLDRIDGQKGLLQSLCLQQKSCGAPAGRSDFKAPAPRTNANMLVHACVYIREAGT